ncbi:MAG: type II secretion system F family protein [Verrucomicrobiales bacterium]
MLKKVTLTNVHTGRHFTAIVDTISDDKAMVGAGRASNETAKISDVTGLDERLQRATGKQPSMDDRVALFSGLAKCFERNISAVKSFQLQASRVKSARYRGAIGEICYDLSQGEKISQAMEKHSDLFGTEVLALIRAGEEAGQLTEVCRMVATGQRKTAKIIRKLKGGMIYPGIVLTIGLVVVIIMSFTLVPAMTKLYGQLKHDLPFATVMLTKLSDFLIHQPWAAAIPVIGLILLFKNMGRIMRVPWVQKVLVRTPVVGPIIRKSAATVSFRALAMLIEANVRLSQALLITADTASHIYYKTFFRRIADHIGNGLTLPESFLLESHWLGDDGRNICGVMELAGETGAGTEMLNEIASDYEEELDNIANQIDKLIEPFTIVILGSLVGFLIYAIYSPVFSLGGALLKK